MFDTLLIGTSGLLANAKALRVVSNNLANVNTPGFKGATLQFSSLFQQNGGQASSAGSGSTSAGMGYGVGTLGARVNFSAGTDQTTNNPLDVAINGNGFYVLKRDGEVLYTRAGDFRFDSAGLLVNGAGDHVQGLGANGQLADISIINLGRSLPKATSTVSISGNLTTANPTVNSALNGVSIIDESGESRPVNLSFKNDGGNSYTVTVSDTAGAVLGTGTLKFAGAAPLADFNSVTFAYVPPGGSAMTVKLDFALNVTNLAGATDLKVVSQDGYAPGTRTDQVIGSDGVLTIKYSNGKTAVGARLAMASFDDKTELDPVSGSNFTLRDGGTVAYGFAQTGTFGSLVSGHREGSNVDLAEEFSNLIITQRGYQAASHVISTANDMIQQLFDMKGR